MKGECKQGGAECSDLSRFMASAGKVSLLSADEEKSLAYTIRRGKRPQASTQEQFEAEQARERFLTANLRLSVSVARKYLWTQEPLLDLVQEGNIGLMTAIEKFDPDKGFKFSTYAINWVRQAITRYIHDKGDTIRIPVHMNEKVSKFRATFCRLQRELDAEPTLEQIATAMGLPVKKVEQIMAAANLAPISLETPVSDEDCCSTIGHFLADSESTAADEAYEEKQLSERVRKALSCLKGNERRVIVLRFGFDGNGERTLEEVGQVLHVTRERVRQIQVSAMEKLAARRGHLASLLST